MSITNIRSGTVSSVFRSRLNLPTMVGATQSGLSSGFASIGYKGKNWRVKHRGEEEILFDERGTPVPDLAVVIVGISPSISKNWYEKRFSEGDSEAPDCFSVDGIVPDAAARNRQSPTCAACPQNMWGSRITDSGKKAKACQDSRRIAVVPSGDIKNEKYDGPMLLRIPPMSLTNLAKYGTELERLGYEPFMVETSLRFDYSVAYPLITFTATTLLDDAAAAEVLEMLDDPQIDRMLAQEAHQKQPAAQAYTAQAAHVQRPVSAAPTVIEPEPEPAPAPAPEPAPAPAPTPAPTPPVAAKKSAFGKKPSMAPAPAPKAAAEPQGVESVLQQPVAPALPTMPSNMEDAIANLLKAPVLPSAH